MCSLVNRDVCFCCGMRELLTRCFYFLWRIYNCLQLNGPWSTFLTNRRMTSLLNYVASRISCCKTFSDPSHASEVTQLSNQLEAFFLLSFTLAGWNLHRGDSKGAMSHWPRPKVERETARGNVVTTSLQPQYLHYAFHLEGHAQLSCLDWQCKDKMVFLSFWDCRRTYFSFQVSASHEGSAQLARVGNEKCFKDTVPCVFRDRSWRELFRLSTLIPELPVDLHSYICI